LPSSSRLPFASGAWRDASSRHADSGPGAFRLRYNWPGSKGFLERSGEEALPVVLANGEVALAGRYPNRVELARWAGPYPRIPAATPTWTGASP
jgi:hypothetical protein